MIDYPGPVLFDCLVEAAENCFPMIPSGKAHNEMILGEEVTDMGAVIDEAGKKLV
jgi:acetolactate synthase-1/2/3 large subunit